MDRERTGPWVDGEATPSAEAHGAGASIGDRRLTLARHRRALQRKAAQGGATTSGAAPAAKGGGMPLPAETRTEMEQSFGANFSSVRVHPDSPTERVGAIAYTRGKDIHFGAGQYDPEGDRGKALLGHELAHVVQQSRGRVGATMQAKGVGVNADDSLEKEADAAGMKAASGEDAGVEGSGSVDGASGEEGEEAEIEDGEEGAEEEGAIQRAVGFEFQTGWGCEKLPPVAEGDAPDADEDKPKAKTKHRSHRHKKDKDKDKDKGKEKEKDKKEKLKGDDDDVAEEKEKPRKKEKEKLAVGGKEALAQRIAAGGGKPFKKFDDVASRGDGFRVEADDGDPGKTEIEYVIRPPFEESPEEQGRVQKVMAGLVAFAQKLRGGGTEPFLLKDVTGDAGDADTLITPGDAEMKARPQASAGIKLDKVGDVLQDKLGFGGTAMTNPGEDFKLKYFPKFKSLLELVHQYLNMGRAQQGGNDQSPLSYPKQIAEPLLARTDFAKIFSMVEPQVQKRYGGQPERFVKEVLKAIGLSDLAGESVIGRGHVGGDDDELGQWKSLDMKLGNQKARERNVARGAEKKKEGQPSAKELKEQRDSHATAVDLTVKDWLGGLVENVAIDRLTQIEDAESMGKLGDKTDKVGPDRGPGKGKQEAPIFEFRADQARQLVPEEWEKYVIEEWFQYMLKLHGHPEKESAAEGGKEKEKEKQEDTSEEDIGSL